MPGPLLSVKWALEGSSSSNQMYVPVVDRSTPQRDDSFATSIRPQGIALGCHNTANSRRSLRRELRVAGTRIVG